MIYVVEDDKSIRELVAYALGSAGYETESYTSSAEFFAALVPQRARLVLLDIMLPGEDGLAILRRLRESLPDCDLYLMAYYPVNPDAKAAQQGWGAEALKVRTNEAIGRANQMVAQLADEFGGTFINVNQGLTDEQGRLKEEFTLDGIHMCPAAYAVVLENLRPYL